MSTDTKTSVTTQIHEIYIKAAAQKIWDAITSPEWTAKYAYQGRVEYQTCAPGGSSARSRRRQCVRWACLKWSSTAR